jgi:hypothetical protein
LEGVLLLDSARSKFERARLHRSRLVSAGIEWLRELEGDPAPIEKRTRPWLDGELITYDVGSPYRSAPSEIGLILGDALNNYRASLDHLAWAIVNMTGSPRKPKQVYFPITQSPEVFASEILRKLPGVSALFASMVKLHQPFQNGAQIVEHPLFILDDWNNADKHRAVHVTAAYSQELKIHVPEDFPNFRVFTREINRSFAYLLPGTELIRIYGKRVDPRKDHGVRVLSCKAEELLRTRAEGS